MWVLIIEACVAFFLFVFIVWWTMYSGQKPTRPLRAEPRPDPAQAPEENQPADLGK